MILKEVAKNSREVFRVSITEYRGRRFVDLRAYYQDAEGNLKPTRKGISLSGEILGDAIEGLSEAANILKAEKTAE